MQQRKLNILFSIVLVGILITLGWMIIKINSKASDDHIHVTMIDHGGFPVTQEDILLLLMKQTNMWDELDIVYFLLPTKHDPELELRYYALPRQVQ